MFANALLGFSHFSVCIGIHNAFIIKLAKMWLGRGPHVVVRTLKISLDQQIFFLQRSLVESCFVM